MYMAREKNHELKMLEQIRNLLTLQLLKNNTATNVEISKALGVTPARSSQMFSMRKKKRKKKKAKKKV